MRQCLCLQQTVTEEKFSILFQSQFSVGGGELVFQVWVSIIFCNNKKKNKKRKEEETCTSVTATIA